MTPTIVIAPGDGIGKEVIPIALKAIETLHPDWTYIPVELGYECYQKTGSSLSDEVFQIMRESDAILFGAVTTPPTKEYQSVLLRIRKELDLYANLRPIQAPNVDILIVRENTEGLYSGIEWIEKDRACTVRVVSETGTRRIIRYALELTKKRNGHLTIGTKANVLASDAYFYEIAVDEISKYPHPIPYTMKYIDLLVLDVIANQARYDVIVTTNIFGDILSDAAAYLCGGLGMLPSANIGVYHAFFEPVHGSAPDIAGTNTANPVGAIRSAALLLQHLGDSDGAASLETAIQNTWAAGIKTKDLFGTASTTEFSDVFLSQLRRLI
ncbi:MAG: NAD-dependent isocitrate dehydrogenase [Methanomicrobiales archaeon]|jgi:methanogen homoisocitrate dehydrogenase|nr:NAD-dependent isocitrate dehydrogenase [Methanomicrobiales archaeon]